MSANNFTVRAFIWSMGAADGIARGLGRAHRIPFLFYGYRLGPMLAEAKSMAVHHIVDKFGSNWFNEHGIVAGAAVGRRPVAFGDRSCSMIVGSMAAPSRGWLAPSCVTLNPDPYQYTFANES